MLVTLALTVAPCLTTLQDQPRIVAHLPEGLKIQRSSLRFAPGGKQLAYVAYRGEDELWVVGDTVGDVYESVEPPVFDATGAHVAFRVATLDKKGKESWTLLVDGKKVATQPWIGPVAFSPVDGTPAFWAAERWEKLGDHEVPGLSMLTVGKKKSTRLELPDQWHPPIFSRDGRFVFSRAIKGDDDVVVVLDLKGKESVLALGDLSSLELSPDGTEVLCTVVENAVPLDTDMSDDEAIGQETQVIVRAPVAPKSKDAKPVFFGSSYESAARPVFSPDGKHLAFVVSQGDKVGVAIDSDTKAACEYDVIDELVFAPSSDQVAYVAVRGCKFDSTPPNGFRPLQTAEELKDGSWSVVQGSTKSEEFDRVTLPRWSPDGTKLAYAALLGTTWRVRVGETKSEGFEEIAAIEWAPDGKTVWFGARKDREFSWTPLAVP
ncbi:MAG: PD40 domain-containing protein [Planctomycetes bacterium]|nr:PD40 domain-containing protein [Planctomycetota bacterium]